MIRPKWQRQDQKTYHKVAQNSNLGFLGTLDIESEINTNDIC